MEKKIQRQYHQQPLKFKVTSKEFDSDSVMPFAYYQYPNKSNIFFSIAFRLISVQIFKIYLQWGVRGAGGGRGGRYYRKKISTADISAFLQLIGKLSLSKKIDLGIIEKLSLSKVCI